MDGLVASSTHVSPKGSWHVIQNPDWQLWLFEYNKQVYLSHCASITDLKAATLRSRTIPNGVQTVLLHSSSLTVAPLSSTTPKHLFRLQWLVPWISLGSLRTLQGSIRTSRGADIALSARNSNFFLQTITHVEIDTRICICMRMGIHGWCVYMYMEATLLHTLAKEEGTHTLCTYTYIYRYIYIYTLYVYI